MGAIGNFFENLGTGLGGVLMPGAYMQGQGISPEQQSALQRASVGQFGLGLLGSIGSGAPIGARLGGAISYASGNAQDQAARLGQNLRYNRSEARQDTRDAAQTAQWAAENAARDRQLKDAEENFKVTSKQTDAALEEARAYHQRAAAAAQTSASAAAENDRSLAATRVAALERQKAQDDAVAKIYADKSLTPDQKTRALQDITLKFSGGVFNPNPYALFNPGMYPGVTPPPAGPTPAQIIQAGQRPPGQ